MSFPHEDVPDGNSLRSHHYLTGLYIVLGVTLFLGQLPVVALGAGIGLFGFIHVWPRFHTVGAILAGAGLVFSLMGCLLALQAGLFAIGGVTMFGVLLAADDYVSHALGLPTPLDLLWRRVIYDRLPST